MRESRVVLRSQELPGGGAGGRGRKGCRAMSGHMTCSTTPPPKSPHHPNNRPLKKKWEKVAHKEIFSKACGRCFDQSADKSVSDQSAELPPPKPYPLHFRLPSHTHTHTQCICYFCVTSSLLFNDQRTTISSFFFSSAGNIPNKLHPPPLHPVPPAGIRTQKLQHQPLQLLRNP